MRPLAPDVDVQGQPIDDETRCSHWSSRQDVVAFKFRCCGHWYPCRRCHDEAVDHDAQTWGPGDVGEHAVLCGACSSTLAIDTYVAYGHTCPYCGADFNPACADHWERYFQPP